eukprot:326430-Chlamydomonas_euryale.AAC.1
MVYEALASTLPFGGARPLHIEFCPAPPPSLSPTAAPPPAPLVWVCGQPLQAVLDVLRDAGVPTPEQVIEIGGQAP